MSDEIPEGKSNNLELNRLLAELELQIDGVNAGLSKIRGTVARISYAALGLPTPVVPASWNVGYGGAPANRPVEPPSTTSEEQTQAPALADTKVRNGSKASPAAFEAPLPNAVFDTETTPPYAEPEHVAETGIWDSVAEGASWPRSQTNADEPVAPVTHGEGQWAWTDASNTSPNQVTPEENHEGNVAEAAMSAETPAQSVTNENEPATEAIDNAAERPATSLPPEMPSTLSSGWPDESAWSQSFDWPAMKQSKVPEPAASDETDESRVDVSDIVAQVRAELEAARKAGSIPEQDIEPEPESVPDMREVEAQSVEVAESGSETPVDGVDDDEARRNEVSRAVAEMRQQLESGNFEDALRDGGRGPSPMWSSGPVGARTGPETGGSESEDDVRAEVRRAVEATREELGTPDKPAFRLAAPGSIPDWSHVQMEPSGPPVVVLKDADGRVELASVYETLNELGCGEGAALLNYTPHSVTVGLPASASFPSQEKVAEAVEKVFGLTSRVESDGVRITVSIGESPKRRSIDAA